MDSEFAVRIVHLELAKSLDYARTQLNDKKKVVNIHHDRQTWQTQREGFKLYTPNSCRT